MADAGSSSTPVADEFKYDDEKAADESTGEISEAAFGNEVDEGEEQQQERVDSRPTSTQGGEDPFVKKDPWKNGGSQRQSGQFAGAVTHAGPQPEAFTRRVIHDEPPEWDGQDPGKNLEPYLKLLTGWLVTTATLPKQRGLIIMRYAKGDLKRLLDTLDIDQLTAPESGQDTADFIKSEYSEYIVKKKNLRLEEALYDTDRLRKNGEGLVQYIARRKDRFNKLQKEGWTIPDDIKRLSVISRRAPPRESA